jgi:cytochrome c2
LASDFVRIFPEHHQKEASMTLTLKGLLPALLLCAFAAPALAQDSEAQEDAQAETQELDAELVAQGEGLWRQCRACHQIGEDAQNRVGPHLNDVIGRTAGGLEGFRYSPAMVEAGEEGLVWDAETLDPFLENPRDKVPGTSMVFAGLRQEGQRTAMIEFLKSHSDMAEDGAAEENDDDESDED